MKRPLMLFVFVMIMLARPAPGDAGILSWFFGLFSGGEARAAARAEARSVGAPASTEGRVSLTAPMARSAANVERSVARMPTSMGSSVVIRQRPSMDVRLGPLTVSTKGSSNGSRRILQNTRAAEPYLASKAQAGAVVPANSKKQVTITRPEVKWRVDLNPDGVPHAGVPTPHIERLPRNTSAPPSLANPYQRTKMVAPATVQEVRIARKSIGK